MTSERWQQVAQLFETAVARPPNERAEFLNDACGADDALRHEVEVLLASDAEGEETFGEIASGVAANWANGNESDDLLGQTLGRYRILSRLGSGGMGEVFLAEDAMLHRKVALKLLPRQFTRDRERLRRFEQEARAASALNHPNIITIFEIGEVDGMRFIVSEYVDGKTLADVIGQRKLSLGEILDVGCQTTSALAAAHQAGIVHRDIKPANIMLREDGFIKVLDFGLAKLASVSQLDVTIAGRVMGTINYMSPEQATGQPLDHRTDIFSLGVVLYELATGQRLFEGKSEAAIYNSILNAPLPPIGDVPSQLEHVLRRAVEKNPARRYQAAAEFRADLKRLADGSGRTAAAAIAARDRRVVMRQRATRYGALAAAVIALLVCGLLLGRRGVVPNDTAKKSVAVLPFENRSADQEQTFFAEGVHDQVLTDLAKISQLKVIGRTSVLQYQPSSARNLSEIAKQLGVAYILEGSVQRAGDKVRVNAHLLDAKNSAEVWAETYDRALADVFAIQSEIATAIANQLEAKLTARERAEIERKPTADLTAFELYTRGHALLAVAESDVDRQQENAQAAIATLEDAVRRDPTYVAAFCDLSRANDLVYWTGIDHSSARANSARAAVDTALRLAPQSGAAHLAFAWHLYSLRDLPAAEQELATARANLPNDPGVLALSGYLYRRIGRWEEATRALEQAVELDPRDPDLFGELAATYHAVHDYTDYVATIERAIAIVPDRVGLHLDRAQAELWWRADTAPLRRFIDDTLRTEPERAPEFLQTQTQLALYERDLGRLEHCLDSLGDNGWYGHDHAKFSRAFGRGMLARLTGDEATAQLHFNEARAQQQRIVESQPDYAPALSMLGLIDAMLGRKDDALREGQRAVELLPVEKDSLAGPFMKWMLAITAGQLGEKDYAIDLLRDLAQHPAGPQYGHFKLDPLFDPLRGDARFQEIVASLAPQ